MKPFLKSLFALKSVRPTARPAAIRLQLEALETRLTPSATAVQTAVLKTSGELDLYNTQTGVFQMLSPTGTIGSVSTAQTAGGQTVVFAIASDTDAAGNLNTLWEYNAAAGGWSEISTGSFQQISAATNASGDAVVFGVLQAGQIIPLNYSTLWEYSASGWSDLSIPPYPPVVPGTQGVGGINLNIVVFDQPPALADVLSVSAVGTSQGEVAFAISAFDHSLWEYAPSSGWSQVSTGYFQQVSAGLDANGQADAFGILGQGAFTGYVGSMWEYDNGGWTQLTNPSNPILQPLVIANPPLPVVPVELPLAYVSVTAGLNGEVFGVVAPGQTLWRNETELSTGSFAQVSATQTSAGADVVFGTLTDGSLWEYTNGGWTELLSGGVAATATPL